MTTPISGGRAESPHLSAAAGSSSAAPVAETCPGGPPSSGAPDSGLRVREGRRAGRFTLPATPMPPAFLALNEAINRRGA